MRNILSENMNQYLNYSYINTLFANSPVASAKKHSITTVHRNAKHMMCNKLQLFMVTNDSGPVPFKIKYIQYTKTK